MKTIWKPMLVTISMTVIIYFVFAFIGMNIYWPLWQENPGKIGFEVLIRYVYLACVVIGSIFIPGGWYDWKAKK
jgi:hypothetical protein